MDVPGSLEERWRPRRRTIAVVGLLAGLVLEMGNALRPCYVGDGGLDTAAPCVAGYLLFRDGGREQERIDVPGAWTTRGDTLAYWSGGKEPQLVLVSAKGPARGLPVKWGAATDVDVAELRATPRAVLMNLQREGRPSVTGAGVLRVDLKTGRVTRVPDAVDAKADPASPVFAVRDTGGRIVLRDEDAPGWEHVLTDGGSEWLAWDCDPARGRVAYVARGVEDDVGYVAPGARWTRRGGWYLIEAVALQPGGDVWVAEDSPLHNAGVAVLTGRGALRGWRVRYTTPLRYPPLREADPRLLALLGRLPRLKDTHH